MSNRFDCWFSFRLRHCRHVVAKNKLLKKKKKGYNEDLPVDLNIIEKFNQTFQTTEGTATTVGVVYEKSEHSIADIYIY